MDLYDAVCRQLARQLTLRYSTSFGTASRLFDQGIRGDIYAIYGLVRVADEIVDTYRGDDAHDLLSRLEADTYAAIARGYSPDVIVHAFARTAGRYGIGEDLVRPFFESMAMDLRPAAFDRQRYDAYIYGSAEVVGLMCLRVFVGGDQARYDQLAPGARALGAAYQKVNFLRDLAADRQELGRQYFPQLQTHELDEDIKRAIIDEIGQDFATARDYIGRLPLSARDAVRTSYRYYGALLDTLRATPADTIVRQRIRVADSRKAGILAAAYLRRRLTVLRRRSASA